MSRKVLISFIGTGRLCDKDSSRQYDTLKYSFPNSARHIETPFVASALGQFLTIDTYLLFGTMHSSWEMVYQYFAKKKDCFEDIDYAIRLFDEAKQANSQTPLSRELFKQIEDLLGNESQIIPIYYGLNQDEIQENFQIFVDALDKLKDGDIIYIDITNSFRSLPLFANTAISFIQDVVNKKISIGGIFYGMMEAKNEFDNVTPIIDLSYISDIQHWIKGSYAFRILGDGHYIADLLREKNKTTAEKIEQFTYVLSMNFIHEIKTQINILTSLASEAFSLPEKLILPKVFKEFSRRFAGLKNQSDYQFELSLWHKENKKYGLAYLCLIESIVTFVCEQEGKDTTSITERECIKKQIKNKAKYADVYSILKEAKIIRNSTAHLCGKNAQKAKDAVKALDGYQVAFKKIITNKP